MTPDSSAEPVRPLAAVVLAAGKGTRMNSTLPKVLHRALGRTVLDWVLAALAPLEPVRTIVVIGHGGDDVRALLPTRIETVVQEQQLGSGDALAAAQAALADFEGDVLVINGDGALFTTATLLAVVDEHRSVGSVASTLATTSDSGLPYGRVLQGADGTIERIVEAPDASPEQLAVRELNAGVYCFDAAMLRRSLPNLSTDNAKGELYITDLFSLAREAGGRTRAVIAGGEDELLGINTRADLAEAERVLQARIIDALLLAGVTISLPETCVIEPGVRVAPDARIEPGTILRGNTTIAAGAVVGPYSVVVDSSIDKGTSVVQSHCVEARVGQDVIVGPYAYLRPGTVMQEGSKAGAFVELKNTNLGPRAKVPHLSYIGDAEVGSDTNIGAGNITANYRPELGAGKQPTRIGSGVRTGSDNVFVAPITIGDGAFTGAGSIIVQDVPAGALAIARARQVNLQDYSQRLAQPRPAEPVQADGV